MDHYGRHTHLSDHHHHLTSTTSHSNDSLCYCRVHGTIALEGADGNLYGISTSDDRQDVAVPTSGRQRHQVAKETRYGLQWDEINQFRLQHYAAGSYSGSNDQHGGHHSHRRREAHCQHDHSHHRRQHHPSNQKNYHYGHQLHLQMKQRNLHSKDGGYDELIGSQNDGYDAILLSKYPQVPQDKFYCLQHPPFYLKSAPPSTAFAAPQRYSNIAPGKRASPSEQVSASARSSGVADHDSMICFSRKVLSSSRSGHHHYHYHRKQGGEGGRAASYPALDSLSLESDDTTTSSSWKCDATAAPATTSVATSGGGGQRGLSECVKNVGKWVSCVGQKVGRGASVIKERFPNQKEHHVVMIGLDGAGKTALLYRLKFDQFINTVPTKGFNCERVRPSTTTRNTDVPKSFASYTEEVPVPTPSRDPLSFLVWDVGGQEKLRPLWRPYTRGTDGVIFVVDSADSLERLEEAKLELHAIMSRTAENAHVPLLVAANKQDLPLARPVDQLASLLGLSELKQLRHIQSVCALTGDGLDLAMKRFHALITEQRKMAKRERNKTR